LLIGTKNFGIISRSENARDPDIREKLKRDKIFWVAIDVRSNINLSHIKKMI
jgi:hypothetical protein